MDNQTSTEFIALELDSGYLEGLRIQGGGNHILGVVNEDSAINLESIGYRVMLIGWMKHFNYSNKLNEACTFQVMLKGLTNHFKSVIEVLLYVGAPKSGRITG